MGAVSKGEYIINLMNKVGYDAIALGNHGLFATFTFRSFLLNKLVDRIVFGLETKLALHDLKANVPEITVSPFGNMPFSSVESAGLVGRRIDPCIADYTNLLSIGLRLYCTKEKADEKSKEISSVILYPKRIVKGY